jgi:hypothetical protein
MIRRLAYIIVLLPGECTKYKIHDRSDRARTVLGPRKHKIEIDVLHDVAAFCRRPPLRLVAVFLHDTSRKVHDLFFRRLLTRTNK